MNQIIRFDKSAVWLVALLAFAFRAHALTQHAEGTTADWPERRQNPHLTGEQSFPGAMKGAPRLLATFDLGRSVPAHTAVKIDGKDVAVCLVAGALEAYALDGTLLWRSHPAGLNFTEMIQAGDLNGDGTPEALLACGRPAQPYGAAAVVDLRDGSLAWRYDVDPMSYDWHIFPGHWLKDAPGMQFAVIMHGYPPDKLNGYMEVFDFAPGAPTPKSRWRHDFEQYTCFPTFLQTDLDGDGQQELAVITHSRMWLFDALDGAVKQFIKWDVAPANVRSYGFNRFVDLNGDGLDDYLCVADFAQHHEVLLNKGGKLEEAWHQGWAESVTVGKVATRYPEPPDIDLTGEAHRAIVLSMFNGDGEAAWAIRVYDAVTGEIKARLPGMIAVACADLDGDGADEILAEACSDPTGTARGGARLLTWRGGTLVTVWSNDAARAVKPDKARKSGKPGKRRDPDWKPCDLRVREDYAVRALAWKGGDAEAELVAPAVDPTPDPPPTPVPNFAKIPPRVGPAPPMLLAADIDKGGGENANELILFAEPNVRALKLKGDRLEPYREFTSSCAPVIADLDHDGRNEMLLVYVSTEGPLAVEAVHADDGTALWRVTLRPPGRPGLPQPRKAYLRTMRSGGTASDPPNLYLWVGTPVARSIMLNGRTGEIIWEKGEIAGSERYQGPSMNDAAAYDFDGDGADELVFTNPDYYCVASAKTGDLLLGPLFPPDIFKQPSQGLYTLPAILDEGRAEPLVALTSGHYFQGVMTLKAAPLWYLLPEPGENRTGAEGFIDREEIMGFGQQSGDFTCVGLGNGQMRWELPTGGTCGDVISGDVDGDGRMEFIFGTSHGAIWAVGDGLEPQSRVPWPRVVWKIETDEAFGSPIFADLDGDGTCELAIPTFGGEVRIYGGGPKFGN